MSRPLPVAFYARDTARVARELLGAVLECTVDGVRCRARIVETEAYVGEHDGACHAARGRTARTEVLYGPPGRAYVYFVYGMHWCVNAVTRAAGLPSAVLIRAAEPLDGLEAMRRRRRAARTDRHLANGPAKLCQALGITGPRHHGASLVTSPLRILAGEPVAERDVAVTPRVGIVEAADWPLRFVVRGSPHLSARRETDRYLQRRDIGGIGRQLTVHG
ncbi:MAG TPA: DNA-3-methyladenine glycosylase [Gemmatimonadaceae bacterium]|nr:DNA-3-methyladenine glycosylase [Gemmatimonadaceae bacterium]